MIFGTTKRIIRSGFNNFWRNGFVTLASILVMTITLFVMGSLMFINAMLDSSLQQIEEKVDINVYFRTDAAESDILAIQDKLEAMPEVASVEYTSRDQAIEEFRERHKDNELIIQSLEEIDDNPLGAYLNIRAVETTQYEAIAEFFASSEALASDGSRIVENENYPQNKDAIDRLSGIINSLDRLSWIVLAVFVVVSVLIIFNTVRLAIYTAREEISVMKLVGASNYYIRGPFIIEGVLYGIIAAVLAIVLMYPITMWAGPFTETFFGSTNLFDYYIDNFAEIFLILVVTGASLGAVSSFLAVKKYLKI